MQTIYVVGALLIPLLGYEFYTLTDPSLYTISVAIKEAGEWNAVVAYVLSVLPGHFFIQPPVSLAEYIGEWGEVFLVLWIGWGLFWYFHTHPNMLPLTWVEYVVLIEFSLLVGGVGWTIGV